jgi:hypothetical protein
VEREEERRERMKYRERKRSSPADFNSAGFRAEVENARTWTLPGL